MASFAPYQQPMGFNPHQFTYHSFSGDVDPSFLPTACDDSNDFAMGYSGGGGCYAQDLNEPYPFNPEQLQQLARYDMVQQHSQLKAGYSFDNQPPVLSSTSDSGASIQSAMSSNMGSPSAQSQQISDWNQFNMCPSIFQQDNGISTSLYEAGTIPGESKIGCVGELSNVSSSHNFSFFQPNICDTTGSWEEHQADARTINHATHPMGSVFLPRKTRGATNDLAFKSQSSPASSAHHFHPRSPVLERVKGRRQTSTVSSPPNRMLGITRLARSSSASSGTEWCYAPRSPIQSPFFSQSSGHFVPPLGSSCP
jgi:hypothetical protein